MHTQIASAFARWKAKLGFAGAVGVTLWWLNTYPPESYFWRALGYFGIIPAVWIVAVVLWSPVWNFLLRHWRNTLTSFLTFLGCGILIGAGLSTSVWFGLKSYAKPDDRASVDTVDTVVSPIQPSVTPTPNKVEETNKIQDPKEIAAEIAKHLPAPSVVTVPSQQQQVTGNLKQRTLALANEMRSFMADRRRNDPRNRKPQPDDLADQQVKFTQLMSAVFQWKFWDQLVQMRNDYAQLSIRNDDLELLLKTREDLRRYGEQDRVPISSGEIDAIPDRLEAMAAQIH